MSVKNSGGEGMAGRLLRAVVMSFILLPWLHALQTHQAVKEHAISLILSCTGTFPADSELNPRVTYVSMELANQFCSFWPSLLLLYKHCLIAQNSV